MRAIRGLLWIFAWTAVMCCAPRHALAQQPVAALLADSRRQIEDLNPDSAAGLLVRVLDPRAGASRAETVRALVLLGIAELMVSRPDGARQSFRQALTLDPQLRLDSLANLHSSLLTTFEAARLSAARGAEPRPAILTRDTDNDGVTDNLDRCADTPANARPVDASGCPLDSDRDGVADHLDRCANTAAGTQVDANGCPVMRDADGDGVIDASDRCPNTPAGSRVDANGCPLAEPTEVPAARVLPEVGQSLVLTAVQFAGAGSGLTAASQTILDGIAAAILATPNSAWQIGAYSSSMGTGAGNLRLSLVRARAVALYLMSRGVASRALTAFGYGTANPDTADGRAQNQRVEIKRTQ